MLKDSPLSWDGVEKSNLENSIIKIIELTKELI